jgi:uncharacterized tellurite resistance protein B-like protein
MDHQAKFKGLMARIFSNAEVDEAERRELQDFISLGLLTAAERDVVVQSFTATTWKSANADGVLSEVEKKRLRSIADELKLAPEDLPPAWAALLTAR